LDEKRILIVDDHPLMQEGLQRVIDDLFPQSCTAMTSNAVETLDAIRSQTWDLVVLDISIPGRNGLEVLSEVKALKPDVPVLVLSMHPEAQLLTRALRAGAAGYLSKSSPTDLVRQAILTVIGGARFISPAGAELLAADLPRDSSSPLHERLSRREFDIFLRIGRGQSVGEIAQALELSIKTIATYRARALAKTGLKNNAEIAQYAIRNNLVE
jgi:DNA-binding NarL/FixJ family response regulator